MSETAEEMLARIKGDKIKEHKPADSIPTKSLKHTDIVTLQNKEFKRRRSMKKAVLKMIDIAFPESKSGNILKGVLPDRYYAEVFAEIVDYEYNVCRMIFLDATLLKELIDIGYPMLLIYKGIKNGKMDI